MKGIVAGHHPIPPETAPLVADIARLPFSHRRYQRRELRALLHSQLETMLAAAGYPNGERGGWVASSERPRGAGVAGRRGRRRGGRRC